MGCLREQASDVTTTESGAPEVHPIGFIIIDKKRSKFYVPYLSALPSLSLSQELERTSVERLEYLPFTLE